MGINRRGKKRTHCMVQECDCTDYELPGCGNECDYCGYKPTKHAVEHDWSFDERDDEQPQPAKKRSRQQEESCCADLTNFEIMDNNCVGSDADKGNSDNKREKLEGHVEENISGLDEGSSIIDDQETSGKYGRGLHHPKLL